MIGKFPKLITTKALSPKTKASMLSTNKKFKASILNELTTMGDEIDLNPLLREYMEGISKAHDYVRSQTNEAARQASVALDLLAASYPANGIQLKNRVGIHVVEIEGGAWLDKIPLLTGTAEYLAYLQSTNRHLSSVGKGFLIGSPEHDNN